MGEVTQDEAFEQLWAEFSEQDRRVLISHRETARLPPEVLAILFAKAFEDDSEDAGRVKMAGWSPEFRQFVRSKAATA